MRTITGAHRNSDKGHMLAETQLLPVREHLGFVCKQFFASASRRNHPSHATVNQPTRSQPGRLSGVVHTLQSRFEHVVQPYLNDDGVLREISYKRTLKGMHTKVVSDNKRLIVSKLLSVAPQDINPEEETLPRLKRCVLTQVRSTYCKNLQTYQNLLRVPQTNSV
jgi:hypothetical protein